MPTATRSSASPIVICSRTMEATSSRASAMMALARARACACD